MTNGTMTAAAPAQAAASVEVSQLRVRPYLLTGGRTRNDVELALETLLSVTTRGTKVLPELHLEQEKIVRSCSEPISIIEIAGRLELPLQVVRVLIGDLVTDGLIEAYVAADVSEERPDLTLLERVLDGLQNL